MFMDSRLNQKDSIFTIIASNHLKDIYLCVLFVGGLGAEIDKKMCPRESTVFSVKTRDRRYGGRVGQSGKR